ncbi:MAG: hypothetical protein IJV00_08435, partial [Clostridia bacterium]|nr:hypothetical protein [Clostridia bacterium]
MSASPSDEAHFFAEDNYECGIVAIPRRYVFAAVFGVGEGSFLRGSAPCPREGSALDPQRAPAL